MNCHEVSDRSDGSARSRTSDGTSEHTLEVVVDEAMTEQRADRVISSLCPQLSRRTVQQLCEAGRVRVGQRIIGKAAILKAGQRVTLTLEAPRRAAPDTEASLVVRFLSEHWVVVNKPGLQPTAPRNAAERGTLANALLAAYPELAELGHSALEPGLLHRLDNGTSGLLVAARNAAAFASASRALREGQWQKRYLAFVAAANLPSAGSIEGELAADPHHRRRVKLVGPLELRSVPVTMPGDFRQHGHARLGLAQRPIAKTEFVVLHARDDLALVEVTVSAAFRHQIRAHFAAAGWPLLNDELYGGAREPMLPPLRHALHAARVAWKGTRDFEGFDVSEALPADLEELRRARFE